MMHAIVPGVAVILCLALAGVVSYDLAPLFLKPRTRIPVVRTARPGGPPLIPASGAAPPTRTDLPIPPPRNGVPLQDRPRQTVDVIICDPAVTPVVPRWYQAYLAGWFRP